MDGENDGDDGGQEDQEFYNIVAATVGCVSAYYGLYIHKQPCMTSTQTGYKWIVELMHAHPVRCFNMFRMDRVVLMELFSHLQSNYGLKHSRRMSALEMVCMFLFVVGQGCSNRSAQERFQHSGETVSRAFVEVLDSVCRMAIDINRPVDPEFKDIPTQIIRDSRYMPHFKDCIGAINGVHVPACISPKDQIPFIGRKGIPTQNVMAACNFDMQFIFSWADWEGTAHDTRIFFAALRNPQLNFPHPPEGKYYLVDAGYPPKKGYLGPYKGERYHLPDFQYGRHASGPHEIFNHAHSSLRSVIEWTFGVWKKKWHIIKCMPAYPFAKQVKIVVATMALHNFIRKNGRKDHDFESVKVDPTFVLDDDSGDVESDTIEGPLGANEMIEMEIIRDQITNSLISSQ